MNALIFLAALFAADPHAPNAAETPKPDRNPTASNPAAAAPIAITPTPIPTVATPTAATPTAEQLKFFEARVRPVLVEHCQKCHGEKKQWGSLRLDSREALLKGGDTGAAIVPGKPAESLFIRAIKHEDDNLKMPEGGKLTDAQIADLVRWVEMGAPFPAAAKVAGRHRDPNHWSFQPPANPPIPAVKNAQHASWPHTTIDHFILARLEAAGLSPAPLADKRTLIRRVTFDLTGLPPTVAEIESFLSDDRPDAYPRLVDRLLASQAYGERWGRHWLDLARYADSNGLDENVAHGNAWRYRDYVVAAFNRDKPFDRFVVEQLAGDLLPAADASQRNEQLIATGFLGIGPKVLAEVDEAKMQMDIVDEQIDTAGRAFLGLTLGCARCHDHKFDPIDTADYYGLAGIFKSTRTMENYKKVAKWFENKLASAAGSKDPQTAMGATEGRVADEPIHVRGNPLKLGETVPRHTPPVMRGPTPPKFSTSQSGRRELAEWLVDPEHPLTSRVFVNRVWRWHFGHGLVRTTDNFGLLGEKPSHPELLDWLARQFVRDGWSVKALHRLIVNSSTYRQSSTPAAETIARDPENRLFSRADVRRLDAEEIRDAMLAVGGQLDTTLGGSLLKVKNRDYFFDHTSKDMTDYTSRRRSLYLPVVRNNVYDLFQLLDFPDPAVAASDRVATTVAPQALMMLNSELVMHAAADFAGRLLAEPAKDGDARLGRAYEIAYGRAATAAECSANRAFLAEIETSLAATEPDAAKRKRQAWNVLSHTLLAANEFIYVK